MNNTLNDLVSHSGMMYSSEFRQWYTYLKRRLEYEWTPQDLSFLLGKPAYYYMDFEKMFDVGKFLKTESVFLDRIYNRFETIKMEFHTELFEIAEERLVRLTVEDHIISKMYTVILPWKFKIGKNSPPAPKLCLEEWKREEDLQLESDAMLHVRMRLDMLLARDFFKRGVMAWDLFQEVEFTGISDLQIFPRHLKNGLYNMIQQGKLTVRNVDGRYAFFVA